MNKVQQVVTEFLKSKGLDVCPNNVIYLFDNDYDLEFEDTDLDWETIRERMKSIDLNISRLELEGGGEGEGEYCYGVIKLGEMCIKAEWSYYSYDGCQFDYIFDTLQEVKPVEKTITVYEKV